MDDSKHLYAIVGAVFKVSENVKLRPTSQLRIADGSPLSIDVSLAAIFNDKFWLGGMCRVKESVGGFIQYQIANQLKMGYAIDLPINGMRGLNVGSHEVMLTYSFVRQQKGIISPRYF